MVARRGIVPVTRLKLSDAVAARLEALVLGGEFGVAGKLPSERDLAEQFGVGRSTMREAIRSLEVVGLIASRHGVGAFIQADLTGSKFPALLSAGGITVRELFQVRHLIEPFTAGECARLHTPEAIARLRSIWDQSEAEDLTDEEFAHLDAQFHRGVVSLAQNRLLEDIYRHVGKSFLIYSVNVLPLPRRREVARGEHLAILNAIAAGKRSEARRAATAHLERAETDINNYLRSQSIKSPVGAEDGEPTNGHPEAGEEGMSA